MAIRYKNPQTGEYEVIKIPVMKGEQGHSGIHVGADAPPTTDVKLWFDPSDTDNDVDLANRLDTTLTACYDYMGNDRGSIKAAADANVDWLLGEINTAHYEGQHITATDSIEGRSKSAILKGQTLVNLVVNGNDKKEITYSSGTKASYQINKDMLVANKTYLLLFTVTDFSGDNFHVSFNLSDASGVERLTDCKDGIFKAKVNFSDLTSIKGTMIIYKITGTVLGGYVENVILVEYQEGMENWDIHYFEGMQSVKMPVLTTTGKNLFDKTKAVENSALVWANGQPFQETGSYVSDFIRVDKNTTYYLSGVSTRTSNTQVFGYDKDKNVIGWFTSDGKEYGSVVSGGLQTNVITITNSDYIRFSTRNINNITPNINEVQLEKGTQSTPYEPYQSNILTVNEDVTLRGIGEVRDTLDCLTGEVVERVGEVVLDGSEDWRISASTRPNHLRLYLPEPRFKQYQNVINNRFADNGNIQGKDIEGVYMTNTIDIQVEHSRLSDVSVDGFKEWLSNNNIKVQAMLSKESIKTVDLSDNHVYSYKDVTHYDCSSAEGSLVPTLSIDVPTNLSALVTKQRNQIETLKEENKGLNQELQLAITSSEENDNELLAQSFELDFRLMEVEFALDLPMATTFRLGGKAMAMTPYEMAKKLILAGNYDRADMEHKLDVYVSKKRMTEAERQELIQLMDEKEGVITTDQIEPEIEESDVEHEAVTIPLH